MLVYSQITFYDFKYVIQDCTNAVRSWYISAFIEWEYLYVYADGFSSLLLDNFQRSNDYTRLFYLLLILLIPSSTNLCATIYGNRCQPDMNVYIIRLQFFFLMNHLKRIFISRICLENVLRAQKLSRDCFLIILRYFSKLVGEF